MTAITQTFFAPERELEYRAKSNKPTWRPLLVSFLFHLAGALLVIVVTQIELERQLQHQIPPRTPSIDARLYYPPPPKVVETEHEEVKSERHQDKAESVPPQLSQPQVIDNATPYQDSQKEPAPKVNGHDDSGNHLSEGESQSAQHQLNQPPPNANQRAGSLNLSVKEAASDYFDHYHQQQIAEDAQTGASEFHRRKNQPVIVDPRKGMTPSTETARPVKKVNCTSTVNKTLAILSGITGGTLACTKMDDHNRFIDARIKPPPKEDN